jgi:hypothetical protein
MGVIKDITGKKFNMLTAIKFVGLDNFGEAKWTFKCDCGNVIITTGSRVRYGTSKSCGCIRAISAFNRRKKRKLYNCKRCGKEIHDIYPRKFCSRSCSSSSNSKKTNLKHGMSNTRFYRLYCNAVRRCNDINGNRYHLYGGRGIKCLWKSFDKFKKDMYKSYLFHVNKFGEKETTLDRIDVNKNYYKNNCRWATNKEQGDNKSNGLKFILNNKSYTINGLCKVSGLDYACIYRRIKKWKDINKVVNIPLYVTKRNKKAKTP